MGGMGADGVLAGGEAEAAPTVMTTVCDAVSGGEPPSLAGAVQVKVTEALPGVAERLVGALGTTGMTTPIVNPWKTPPGTGKFEAA